VASEASPAVIAAARRRPLWRMFMAADSGSRLSAACGGVQSRLWAQLRRGRRRRIRSARGSLARCACTRRDDVPRRPAGYARAC
jgi:hypothetical protein